MLFVKAIFKVVFDLLAVRKIGALPRGFVCELMFCFMTALDLGPNYAVKVAVGIGL